MTEPKPITLPADQYGHHGVPEEWWWHTGTLKGARGDFGFEINVMRLSGDGKSAAVMELELIDVAQKKNYQTTQVVEPAPAEMCEYDPAKPWFVEIKNDVASVSMRGPAQPPSNPDQIEMIVEAKFLSDTLEEIELHLKLEQSTKPLLVWGTGSKQIHPNTHPNEYNYYYSLTDLQAHGSVKIINAFTTRDATVHGITWMDHEYGFFPKGYFWIWDGIRLSNGVSILSYTDPAKEIAPGVKIPGQATVLLPDGTSHFVDATTVMVSKPQKIVDRTYYEHVQIEINKDGIEATLELQSLVPNQLIVGPAWEHNVFEGVASCTGTFRSSPNLTPEDVSGTGWIEQKFKPVDPWKLES